MEVCEGCVFLKCKEFIMLASAGLGLPGFWINLIRTVPWVSLRFHAEGAEKCLGFPHVQLFISRLGDTGLYHGAYINSGLLDKRCS